MKRKIRFGLTATALILLVAALTGCPGLFDPAETGGGQAPPDDQVSVDLTGWWGFTFEPEGGDPFGPAALYIYQSGSALSTPWGLTGATDGSSVTLGGQMYDDYGGASFDMSGTISDGVIGGSVTSGMGDGTFTLARPTPPFGELAVHGTLGGEPVEFETVHVFLGSADSSAEYGFSFETSIGWVHIHWGSVEPSAGTFAVTADPDETDAVQVRLFSEGDDEGYQATGGEIVINAHGDAGTEGTFDLTFPEGDWLSGEFNVIFDSDEGETWIEGLLGGVDIEPSQLTEAWSGQYVDVSSGLYMQAASGQLEVRLELMWNGPLEAGEMLFHDYNWRGGVEFRPFGGPYGNFGLNESSTGTLTLTVTRLDEDGIAGSFVEVGSDLNVEFDVNFGGFAHY